MKKMIGILVVSLVLGASSARAQKSGTQNVVVTNTSASPVPTVAQGTTNVAGTVGITGLVDVNVMNMPLVTLSGTPTVYLSPGSSIGINGLVQVTNTPLAPLHVRDTRHATAFVVRGSFSMIDGQLEKLNTQNIPAGKMFVIESVSVKAILPGGQKLLSAGVIVETYGQSGTNFFSVDPEAFQMPVTFRGTTSGGADVFAGSQGMRLYSQGLIGLFTQRSGSSQTVTIEYRFSGYLVDLP